MGRKQRLEMDETAAQNREHGRSTVLGKEMFLRDIWTSPGRVSVREEKEGHLFHVSVDWKQVWNIKTKQKN